MVEWELRPAAELKKPESGLLSLSPQYLIRNLGAGPWPGTHTDTLSRHSHSCSFSHTLSSAQGGETEGHGHSLKGSTQVSAVILLQFLCLVVP